MNIGSLSRRQLFGLTAAATAWAFDGPRAAKQGMLARSVRPEDLEMPLAGFQDYITPIEHFFVRSHHYEPTVDMASWRLEVDGEVGTKLSLTLDDLRKMPKVEVIAVCECAGNGRAFYQPTVPGLQWQYGSVGNGRWTGVRLADVLKSAGVKPSAKEILLDGVDVAVGTMPKFQRTITAKKALDPNTILAYEMNGKTLPNQHGFPLRVIAPGWASDSWVKWLKKITVLDHEFDGFFMKTAYRHPGKPVKPGQAVDPAQMQPVTSLKVKSVIGGPADGSDVAMGKPLTITGAAWSGDGGPVTSVDVSTDGGRSWSPAKLGVERSQFGWRLFSHSFTPPAAQYYTLMSRARSGTDVQPLQQEWNPSGYSWNVVHAVGINAVANYQRPPIVADDTGMGDAMTRMKDWPAGYKESCLACHGEDVIVQQKLTQGQWEREVDKMIRWGAQVKTDNRAALIRYLSSHFGK